MIKWSNLTPEQRDRLVAERVMGWQEKECDSQMIEYDGGWECSVCGLSGGWSDFGQVWDYHIALPPHYTTSMDAAKKLRQRIAQIDPMLNLHMIVYAYNRCYAAFSFEPPIDNNEWSEGNGEHCMEEAISLAALRTVGAEIEQ